MARELTKDEAIAVKAIGDLVTKTEELNALKGDIRTLVEEMKKDEETITDEDCSASTAIRVQRKRVEKLTGGDAIEQDK